MHMYLNAESKEGIGYTPDWLRVGFTKNDNDYSLCFDIQEILTIRKVNLC